MKLNKKKFYKLAVVVLLLIFVGAAGYIFNEGQKDTKGVETRASLTTQELFTQSQEEISTDLALYIERAIEVKGNIKDITHRDGTYSIILNGLDERHIICEMQIDQNTDVQNFVIGEEVVIKGILKGFLFDAILLNCIVI